MCAIREGGRFYPVPMPADGARTAEARRLLEQSRPDFLLSDMTELPTLLEQIEGQTIDLRGAQLCQE